MAEFGELLRAYRLGAGLTQRELAGRAHVGLRTVRDIERQRVTAPRSSSVRRLAEALGLPDGDRERLLATAGMNAGRLFVAVLGPLLVYRGEVTVEVLTARQRCVLALLAMHAGRLVPAEEIVDMLWGDRPPASCRRLVHLYVGQLRSMVEPGRLLVTAHGGYRMDLANDQLDLTQFDELALRARKAQASGDPDLAAELFDEALACWRGPVLADVDIRARQHPTAIAASERRLAALLAFADLAISAGRHEQAALRLRDVAPEAPLHEGLHARLMLALAGSGQQAAALELFSTMRSLLADELGIEPGSEIQAAHLRVLRQDIPHRTSHGSAVALRTAPAQLPADVVSFTGRAEHLRRLDSLLPAADFTAVVITAIAGTAGIGKTALAVHWAHRAAKHFPDGQLYVNLRGFDPAGSPVTPIEAVRGFLGALYVPAERIPITLDAQTALYRSLLAGKRMLLVLDNARDAEQVRPLLPGAPGCVVVVTSRDKLSSLVAKDGAQPLILDLLTTAEARELLARRLGAGRLAAEPKPAQEIITLCARLPLALAIVAARAATHPEFPLAALAGELRDSHGGLDAFDGGDPASDVRSVFSWSYNTLTDSAAEVFRLLGLHPGPDISTAAAASLAGVPPRRVKPVLAELARAHLITEHFPGRFTFHDLLRAFATEQSTASRTALHRVLDHYLHTAYKCALLLRPLRDPISLTAPHPGVAPEALSDYDQALAWFNAEHLVLVAAVETAARNGFDVHTWQLAWTLVDFFDRQGHWHDQAVTQRTGLRAAQLLSDQSGQARAHRSLAGASAHLRCFSDAYAHLQSALDLYGELGEPIGQANIHLNFAQIHELEGQRHGDALRHADHALELYQTAGHQPGHASALNTVGWCHAQLGDYQQALTFCGQALDLLQKLGDRSGEASTWDSLGYIRHRLGDHDQAIDCYEQALRLTRGLGDRNYEAEALVSLGDIYEAAGADDAARDAWRQALSILDELGRPDADNVRVKLESLD